MERVETLIKRLLELHDSHADVSALLLTAQMLVHELQENNKTVSSGKKVSVIHPGIKHSEPIVIKTSIPAVEKISHVAEHSVSAEQPITIREERSIIEIPEEKKESVRTFVPLPKIEEMPTYAYQQKDMFELNNSVSTSGEQTLNERLKIEQRELGNILKDSPVKDLKKAIGINDRFVFIDELFRGDENMYERSIKTINGFSIFPEAEYWIQRELKSKIGWDEESQTVRHFDQLIRRRFS
ncbi:MAG: hypothetical protein ABI861_11430 [Panacibacter sp.]